ncbi:hypothetical protein UFOVP84_200 [uncultured Caudovirales phage]|uniref:Uncharacterized protein n=1 Tax=uncultured Caudovirales phage TaxID=2100421 RepID=A0A6J5KYB4_9CAUD|nr:hypothetical protein UFOVP84_200 [uncultured Caudovirales phage]
MNDKIENLKKQCYISLIDRDGNMEYDMKKFAELIIKETLEVVRDEVQYALDDYLADTIDIRVKNHFGIE